MSDVPDPAAQPARRWWRSRAAQLALSVAVVALIGLTASLGSGLPDGTKNQIAAAVLLCRVLTWLLPIPLGLGCWIFWRSNTSWRRSPSERLAWRFDEVDSVPGVVPLDPVP